MKGQTLIPSRPHADNSPPKIIDCCVTVYVHLGECYHPINIISPDTYRRAYKMLQHCMYCFIILSPTVDCCIIYLPPPFKDIPNIYSASPARKPICALSMPPPSSPSSTKRPFNVFTQNTASYHPRKSDGVRSCFHRHLVAMRHGRSKVGEGRCGRRTTTSGRGDEQHSPNGDGGGGQ